MIKNHIVYNPILEYKFTMKKAVGSFLWASDGKRIIDFTSGWNITNLGWNNPEISEAMKQQISKNTYTPSWIADEVQTRYAAALTAQLPANLNAICRVTSGTEANEQAIKIARTVTGRKKILGFFDSYHGSTFASLSVGYRPEYLENLAPVVGDMIHIEYPKLTSSSTAPETLKKCLDSLENALKGEDVAAILTEAGIVTGWGSMSVAPPGFLREVKRLAEKYGTLLILDEVGTGFSRCGSLFAFQQEGITPDILTFAKAMANGVTAMGACITDQAILEGVIPQAKVLSSLAWMPLACAAAEKALEIHVRDKMWETATTNGEYVTNRLQQIANGQSTFVRGKGMELGIDFTKFAAEKDNFNYTMLIAERAFENGLLLSHSDAATLQLMPPLTTSKEILKEGLDILTEAVEFADKKHSMPGRK